MEREELEKYNEMSVYAFYKSGDSIYSDEGMGIVHNGFFYVANGEFNLDCDRFVVSIKRYSPENVKSIESDVPLDSRDLVLIDAIEHNRSEIALIAKVDRKWDPEDRNFEMGKAIDWIFKDRDTI